MTAARTLVIVAAATGLASASPLDPPVARFAPKGRPLQRSQQPGAQQVGATEYLYVGARQNVEAHGAGAGATILQADPAVGVGDFHSLAEIAVESTGGLQIVELGWTVDFAVNGDLQPHVFAFHWVDGVQACYNGCGWVQVSPNKQPGMRVVPGESHRYDIQLVDGDWWLSYDGEAMGYYPQSLWGGRFKQAGLVQWFGEVAAAVSSPCTQMGNGKFGADSAATLYGELHLFDGDGAAVSATAEMGALTNPALYSIGRTTPTSFGFGGPGATSGCCTPASCVTAQAECGQIADPVCAGNTLACGACRDPDVCTPDHRCPAGVGPRDGGELLDGLPGDRTGAGCCDAGASGPGGAAMLGAVVAGVVRRRRRARRGEPAAF